MLRFESWRGGAFPRYFFIVFCFESANSVKFVLFAQDVVVGEMCLKLSSISPNDDQGSKYSLYVKGKKTKGRITLTSNWEDGQADCGPLDAGNGGRRLRIVIKEVENVKDASIFSSNDLYVDAYCVPTGTDPASQALPAPSKKTILPASSPNEHVFPFQFRLPTDMPSTLEPGKRSDFSVQYFIYACIDVAYKLDPECSKHFTVVQPTCADTYGYPQSNRRNLPLPAPPRCFPFYRLPVPWMNMGPVQLDIRLARTGHAPGELLTIHGRVVNGTGNECRLSVVLLRYCELRAHAMSIRDAISSGLAGEQKWRVYAHNLDPVVMAAAEVKIGARSGADINPSVATLRIPPVAPSFGGCLCFDIQQVRSAFAAPRGLL
jgi:hypothetical protein